MNLNSIPEQDWIIANQRYAPPKKLEPPVDEEVSKIVGRKVYQRDPKLIKLVLKWRGNKPLDSKKPDNFLKDPEKIKELKKTFGYD